MASTEHKRYAPVLKLQAINHTSLHSNGPSVRADGASPDRIFQTVRPNISPAATLFADCFEGFQRLVSRSEVNQFYPFLRDQDSADCSKPLLNNRPRPVVHVRIRNAERVRTRARMGHRIDIVSASGGGGGTLETDAIL